MAVVSLHSNLAAMRAHSSYASFTRQLGSTMERLATGKRINRGADDPAGLQVVDQMKQRLAVINSRLDRLGYEDAYYGAREGAQSAVSELLIELQGTLTASANTGGLTEDERVALQDQAQGIIKAIDHLANTTVFNNQQLLTGFSAANLGIAGLDLVNGDREAAQQALKGAISMVSGSRAAIGTQLKANDSERRLLQGELENLQSARSLIEDADYAKETAELIRERTLQQASLFMMQLAMDRQDELMKLLTQDQKRHTQD
jgi:flagellin